MKATIDRCFPVKILVSLDVSLKFERKQKNIFFLGILRLTTDRFLPFYIIKFLVVIHSSLSSVRLHALIDRKKKKEKNRGAGNSSLSFFYPFIQHVILRVRQTTNSNSVVCDY